jgi:hypothetical protein
MRLCRFGQYLPEAKTIPEFVEWLVGPRKDMSVLQGLLESSPGVLTAEREQRVREAWRNRDIAAIKQLINEDVERAAQDPALMKRIEKAVAELRLSDADLNKVPTIDLNKPTTAPKSRAEMIRQGASGASKIDFGTPPPGVLALDVGALCNFAINSITLSHVELFGSAVAMRRILGARGVVVQDCAIDLQGRAMLDVLLRRATAVNKKEMPSDFKSGGVLLRTHTADQFLGVVESSTPAPSSGPATNSGASVPATSKDMCVRKGKVCLDTTGKATASVALSCGNGPELALTTDGALELTAGPVSLKIGPE